MIHEVMSGLRGRTGFHQYGAALKLWIWLLSRGLHQGRQLSPARGTTLAGVLFAAAGGPFAVLTGLLGPDRQIGWRGCRTAVSASAMSALAMVLELVR
jgi:hypothetical protein